MRRYAPAAAAGEPQNRPAAAAGDGGHLAFRIGRTRVADQIHQRDVFVTVGVEIAVLEVNVIRGGEFLYRSGLARSPQNRLDDSSGEDPVVVGLELVGERVEDAEEAGYRRDLNGESRGAEHHGVPARQVGADQLAHLRVDPGLDSLGEQPLADLLQITQHASAQGRGGLADELFELDAHELMVQAGRDHADQLADAHVAAPDALLGEDDGGEAGHQGPVQVEECADLGSGRAGHDFGDRPRQPKIARRFPRLPIVAFGRGHERAADRVEVPDGSASNDAGTARGAGSPTSARISSKPSSRHRANSASSLIAARSQRVVIVQ